VQGPSGQHWTFEEAGKELLLGYAIPLGSIHQTARRETMKKTSALILVVLFAILAVQSASMALIEQATNAAEIMRNEIEVMINDMRKERMDAKKLEKFQNQLLGHMKKLKEIRNGVKEEAGKAETEKRNLLGKHGDTPLSQWSQEDQKRWQRCEEVLQNAEKTSAALDETQEQLKQINASLAGKDAKTFNNLLQPYLRQMEKVGKSLKDLSKAGGATTVYDPSKASPLEVINDSKNIHFFINGLELKPGEKKKIAMPSGRTLAIRALAVTERRNFIRTKGLTKNTISHERDDWHFTYTIDTGAGPNTGTWKVEKEEYTWTGPTMLLQTKTPFDPGKSSAASQKATNDVLTWEVPIISKSRFGEGSLGTQSFLIQLYGDITWRFTREGATTQSVSKTEDESFRGSLTVKVAPE
jgi:hypothetical protein